jgi:hypothetical protein
METVKPKRTKEEARAYQRAYYQAHKEQVKELVKKFHVENPDYLKEYYKKNKEKIAAKRKEYQAANREKISAKQREWRYKNFAENPEQVRIQRRAKKARQKAKDPVTWNAKAAKANINAQKKMVAELTDSYVRQRLARDPKDGPRKISAKDIPQSLVEAKRLQLLILRRMKNEEHNRIDHATN